MSEIFSCKDVFCHKDKTSTLVAVSVRLRYWRRASGVSQPIGLSVQVDVDKCFQRLTIFLVDDRLLDGPHRLSMVFNPLHSPIDSL